MRMSNHRYKAWDKYDEFWTTNFLIDSNGDVYDEYMTICLNDELDVYESIDNGEWLEY